MKRLLLLAALVAPTWLYSCMPKSVVPDPSAVVQETFDNLPKLPEVREIPILPGQVAPTLPTYKPAPKKRAAPYQVKKHGPVATPRPAVRPLPRVRPSAPEAPVETLPPQHGTICIFPFSLIPQCYAAPNETP